MRDFCYCVVMDDWLSHPDTVATSITSEGNWPGWIDLQNVFSRVALKWHNIKPKHVLPLVLTEQYNPSASQSKMKCRIA